MSNTSSISEIDNIREQIKNLKDKLKIEQNVFRIKGGLITDEMLEKMSVKELRGLVAKHKIFKGITRLKKSEIIEKIKNSDWYNGQQAPPLPPKKRKKIKDLNKDEDENKNKIPEAPPIPPPEQNENTKKEDAKLLDLDEDTMPIEPPKLERQNAVIGEETRSEKRKRLLKELEELDKNNEEHPLISKKENDKKQMDLGHTIVNIYCGGNSHPDYPIPQSVVRNALNSQNLEPPLQKQVEQFLRQEAIQTPLSDIKKKFSKTEIPAVKKFPKVETTKPLQKPILPTKTEVKTSSNFEDDDEEEETSEERAKRERAEEIAKEIGKSKGKGKTEKFKSRLEGILGARFPKKS